MTTTSLQAGASQDETTPGTSISARLKTAHALFRDGQISRVVVSLAQLAEQPISEAQRQDVVFLTLGCALYGHGDLVAARRLNQSLDPSQWPTIRYRLALRQGDWTTAKTIRAARQDQPKEQADFRLSMGLHLIWRHKPKLGFPFYQSRANAINFTKILPNALSYAPLPDKAEDDLPFMVLEQGVGDILCHLAHLKELAPDADYTFIGDTRYRALVAQTFPAARFANINRLPDALIGQTVHASADILGRYYRRFNRFGPVRPFAGLSPRPASYPLIGISWRGGSGQNRREERSIPLAFFLDLLPDSARYAVLQADLTEEEKTLLKNDGRAVLPLVDLKGDVQNVLNMVAGLRAVISVDNANVHFAGAVGTPSFTLMNPNSHWFWGPSAEVGTIYKNATTVLRPKLSKSDLAEWVAGLPQRQSTPAVQTSKNETLVDKPLFVTGLPRSGTSFVCSRLKEAGFWFGETVGPTAENPKGFFENRQIREVYVKGILRGAGTDPRGVLPLPRLDMLPPFPGLAFQLKRTIDREGYTGESPWVFKDPKLALVWPLFAQAFPKARWLIVARDRDLVIDSLTRTSFMARRSTDPHFWQSFCTSYAWRLDALKATQRCHVVLLSDLAQGRTDALNTFLSEHYDLRRI